MSVCSLIFSRGPRCRLNRIVSEKLRCLHVFGPGCFQKADMMNIFDRKAKRLQRDRAAMQSDANVYQYLREECCFSIAQIGFRVADRVFDIRRRFNVAVDLGCGLGYVGQHLDKEAVEVLFQCDISGEMVRSCSHSKNDSTTDIKLFNIVADEEFLPFRPDSLDLVVSSLSLHWVNDIPGAFRQIHDALKNDGAFIAALFGGDTLFELRCSLQLSELEREGGFAPHISPFAEVRDIGSQLTLCGYKLLTVDVDEIKVNYPSMFELLWDLKGMAENNASWNRKLHLRRDSLLAAAAIYKEMYGNADGTIPATFRILYLIGWKADPSQANPAERGSGQVSFKDISKLANPSNVTT